MEVFNWVNDIEKVYEDLIEKAKDINLTEIKVSREKQEKVLEALLKQKNELTTTSLKNLSADVQDRIKDFRKKLNEAINNIENVYQKEKKNLEDLILEKLGFDF